MHATVKPVLVILLLMTTGVSIGQNNVYSTSGGQKNTVANSAYVTPVVSKVYTFNSPGYQVPANTSYNSYKTNSSGPASVNSASSQNNGSGEYQTKGIRIKPGIYLEKNGKWGVTNYQGYKASPAIYDMMVEMSRVSMGIFSVMVKANGKWGVIYTADGTPIIPLEYDEMTMIDTHQVMVKKGNKLGMITFGIPGSAKTVIPVENDEIGLSGRYYWLRVGDKMGLLASDFSTVLQTIYQDIRYFSEQGYLVKKNNKMGLMSYWGLPLLPIEYESISSATQNLAWVLKDGKWGLISHSGKVLAVPQYDTIYTQPGGLVWVNDMAVVSKAGKLTYINDEGIEINESNAPGNAPQAQKMDEDFSGTAGKFKWPEHEGAVIKGGVYEITATTGSYTNVEIPFPDEIRYEPGDDWMLELRVKDIENPDIIGTYGIMIKNKSYATDISYYTFNNTEWANITCAGNAQTLGKLKKINKKDYNTLKLIKRGRTMDVYYNGKSVLTGSLASTQIVSGKFYLVVQQPWKAGLHVVDFDDIKFEILQQK